jgi:hypothetical protein
VVKTWTSLWCGSICRKLRVDKLAIEPVTRIALGLRPQVQIYLKFLGLCDHAGKRWSCHGLAPEAGHGKPREVGRSDFRHQGNQLSVSRPVPPALSRPKFHNQRAQSMARKSCGLDDLRSASLVP